MLNSSSLEILETLLTWLWIEAMLVSMAMHWALSDCSVVVVAAWKSLFMWIPSPSHTAQKIPQSCSVLLPLKFHQFRGQKPMFCDRRSKDTALHCQRREVLSSQPLCILLGYCVACGHGHIEKIPLPAHLLRCCCFLHNRCHIMWYSLNKSNTPVSDFINRHNFLDFIIQTRGRVTMGNSGLSLNFH